MDRSRTRKALGSEEEEGRISSLSDEDLRARNKVLEPKDERKWLCLVGSEKKFEKSQIYLVGQNVEYFKYSFIQVLTKCKQLKAKVPKARKNLYNTSNNL